MEDASAPVENAVGSLAARRRNILYRQPEGAAVGIERGPRVITPARLIVLVIEAIAVGSDTHIRKARCVLVLERIGSTGEVVRTTKGKDNHGSMIEAHLDRWIEQVIAQRGKIVLVHKTG